MSVVLGAAMDNEVAVEVTARGQVLPRVKKSAHPKGQWDGVI